MSFYENFLVISYYIYIISYSYILIIYLPDSAPSCFCAACVDEGLDPAAPVRPRVKLCTQVLARPAR